MTKNEQDKQGVGPLPLLEIQEQIDREIERAIRSLETIREHVWKLETSK